MRKSERILKILAVSILGTTCFAILVVGIVGIFIYKNIDFEGDEILFEASRSFESTTFYADSGELEGEYTPVAVEIAGSFRKRHVSLGDISPYIKEGFVAVEDKLFYKHRGVDLRRTFLALLNQFVRKEKTFGASTITQQVVKNISGDKEVKIKRKITEIIRAINLEQHYSKDEIFELYLNVIPMSENFYGIASASLGYFGKEPSELNISESATLIGITNAPTAFNPYNNPEACKRKRDTVLYVMKDDGIITEEEFNSAKSMPISVIPREERIDRYDSWFAEVVVEDIVNDLEEKYNLSESAARLAIMNGGYSVYTTMNISVQEILEKYFENLDNFPKEVTDGLNYSMVVADSENGNLLGVVGQVGEKKGNRLLNHASIPHIPGSVLKPIALYAPLIDEGKINWATVFDDVPSSFIEEENGIREYPRNSPNVYDGLTTVKDAMRNSKNTIAVTLCNIRKPESVFETLYNQYGFDTLIKKEQNNGKTFTDVAIAPMALGQLSRGVSLLKLTEAFGVFPNYGTLNKMRSYLKVVDYNGKTILENKEESKRILKKSTAEIMNKLLENVVYDGTAKNVTLKEKVSTAGKTGTSGGSKDKMFLGYTPYCVGGIWCGYDTGEKAVTVSNSHLKIWDEVMLEIQNKCFDGKKQKSFTTDEVVLMSYCVDSGEKYSENCIYDVRGIRKEYGYFTVDNMPNQICTRHIICGYDSETKGIANMDCPKENIVPVSLLRIDNRAFPKEVYITDAEYVYRDVGAYGKRPDSELPYFYNELADGEYAGISKKSKQFNSNCNIHHK